MKLKQKSDVFFDERLADRTVIANLIKVINRSKSMSKILQDENGVLYLVHNFEKLVKEDLDELLNTLKEDVKLLETGEVNEEDGSVKVAAPATPDPTPSAPAIPAADPTPSTDGGTPNDPATPTPAAPAGQPSQPDATDAPADSSDTPATPPADPASPPADPAPADPNSVTLQ